MTTSPTIVVGVEHTPGSAAALRWAAAEALRTEARLRAIYVWRCSDTAKNQQRTDVEREEVHTNATRWIVEALVHISSDVDVSVEILDGDPGATLVAAATEARLLVLGADTFTSVGLPASTVVEYCTANSPCRVVVIDGCDRRVPSSRAYAEAS